MINLEVLKGIVGDNKTITLNSSEWSEIVKLVPNNEEGYNFLSGEDLDGESVYDLLWELGVEVVFD
jgi:hypothetical protein